ncbi:MAG: fibronectin type III domain-containing protein [Luminiphilus sp.]|nr:fibronectin type III domain-containing protein [Luminiphilus sp.]
MTRSVIGITALINLLMACPVAAAEGDLDTTFDSDGKVTTAIGSSRDFASAVAIQSDGKIVAAGHSPSGSSFDTVDFALVRYNTDGTLDTNFDSDGKVTTDIGIGDNAYSVAIQSDGKIVAAGFTYPGGGPADFALERYNTYGTLDTSFDSDGKVTTEVGTNDYAYSVAIQSDGKIVAAGGAGMDFSGNVFDIALVRYLGITPPATPSAPTATIGNGQATVTWTKPADNGSAITGYTVTSSGGQTCTTSDANTLTCIVTGLTNGTAYTFTVTATNGGGASVASVASSSITPVAPTPVLTLPLFGLGILVSLLGLFGLRKLRQ